VNGELAALIAVVLHGNAWLANPTSEPPSLERENSTYRYVQSLTFVEPKQGFFRRERRYMGTAEWLAALRSEGVKTLALFNPTQSTGELSAPIATSFANGVPRGVVTDSRAQTLWSSNWQTDGSDHPDGEIWRVTMTSYGIAPVPAMRPRPPAEAHASLHESVEAARTFAKANNLNGWVDWFGKALAVSESSNPEVPYNPDIVPAGWLSLEQRQLLAFAVQAWVFGGMGSWNDIWLEDESQGDRYRAVTEQLYESLIAALVAVTNVRYWDSSCVHQRPGYPDSAYLDPGLIDTTTVRRLTRPGIAGRVQPCLHLPCSRRVSSSPARPPVRRHVRSTTTCRI